jgi:two-component system LytT family sensor kinase
MIELMTLMLESLRNHIDELAYIFLTALVFLSAYYWLNTKFAGIIRSTILRRNIIGFLILIIYSIYYFTLLYGKIAHQFEGEADELKPYVQSYYTMVISSFVCLNLYYLLTYRFALNSRQWVSAVKFIIFFIIMYLAMIGTNWPIYGLDLKKTIPFYPIVALLVASIDVGCRYIISLQQLLKKARELETLQLKEQLTHSQLDALHAKINPHFLYNALNSIAGFSLTDGHKTRQMAVSLSKFFRYSINREQSNLTTLQEELEMVETYLEIEKIRFEDLLNYEITMEPGLKELKIPRFLLQPLVENAVKHGLKGDRHELFIRIHALRDGKRLSLSVQDNGLPFADNFEPGYGLKSVYDKLDLLFPEKYEVTLFNTPVKQVSIFIET